MTRIAIAGCAGRMGRMLLAEVLDGGAAELAGGSERHGDPAIGSDLGVLAGRAPVGRACSDDPRAVFAAADVVIDFTTPAASAAHATIAAEAGAALVIGTTGLSPAQTAALEAAARRVAVVWAPNMSVGVTLLLDLVERVAGLLDPSYDIEIVEMHHRHKVDAPSGTALALGRAAAAGRGVHLEDVWRKSRDGQTGARPEGEIGFATLRGGDVVGDHAVIFAADGERIEIAHKASSRRVFARGAVRAALWAAAQPPGLYTMADVLGTARDGR